MRIICKWTDYYDKIQAYGQDDKVVYHRITRDVLTAAPDDLTYHFYQKELRYRGTTRIIAPFTIGFCGKLYRGVCVTGDWATNRIHCYSVKDVLSTLQKAGSAASNWQTRYYIRDLETLEDVLTKWFERSRESQAFENWSITNKLPVVGHQYQNRTNSFFQVECDSEYRDLEFIGGGKRSRLDNLLSGTSQAVVVADIRLFDIDFQKVVDPYTAYQELDMFIGGVLSAPSNPMIPITDKDRIKQHGFDKWSFRKMGKNSKV